MHLPPAEWYASLPSFLASATALLTDDAGRILLVKPNYRPHWNLPGGVLHGDEPPHACCTREVREELGVDIVTGGLLVVDWVPPTADRKAWFGFVFDGGVLPPGQSIELQADELDGYEFVPADEATTRLTTNTANRLRAALQAKAAGTTRYLFNGREVHTPPAPHQASL
ncbi:NUDIX domain-containing protein [Longispora albida]|uniref:NUDIX domain-containing protein n=1 Tax=Longispora albida TaxID=203523 RepID=UPI00037C8C63|nr:NUDIX hydrolase [Longispora albida]